MSEAIQDRAGGLRDLWRAYFQRRYRILFYSLFLTTVAAPVLSAFELRGVLIELLLAVNLLAAVMPVEVGRRRPFLVAVIAVVWMARLATVWFDHPALTAMTLGVWTLIGLLAAGAALRSAMGVTKVDAEHLYAALSAYLLVAPTRRGADLGDLFESVADAVESFEAEKP
jgi:voltage-gated potassium channel